MYDCFATFSPASPVLLSVRVEAAPQLEVSKLLSNNNKSCKFGMDFSHIGIFPVRLLLYKEIVSNLSMLISPGAMCPEIRLRPNDKCCKLNSFAMRLGIGPRILLLSRSKCVSCDNWVSPSCNSPLKPLSLNQISRRDVRWVSKSNFNSPLKLLCRAEMTIKFVHLPNAYSGNSPRR